MNPSPLSLQFSTLKTSSFCRLDNEGIGPEIPVLWRAIDSVPCFIFHFGCSFFGMKTGDKEILIVRLGEATRHHVPDTSASLGDVTNKYALTHINTVANIWEATLQVFIIE